MYNEKQFIEAGLAGKIEMTQGDLGITFTYFDLMGEKKQRFVKQAVIDQFVSAEDQAIAVAEDQLAGLNDLKKSLTETIKNKRDLSKLKRKKKKK